MAWYHDEWNKQNELEQSEAHKERVIQQSNFWATLQRQIDQDVAGINDSPWKERLAGHPLTAQYSKGIGGDYVIRKPSHPQAAITLRNQADHIQLERHFADIRGVEQYPAKERLTVVSDGKHVYIQTEGNKRLGVPEEAAQYILKPMLQLLKTATLD